MPSSSSKPLVLLDRDGTLIVEGHFITDPKDVKLYHGVPAALRRLKQAGFKVVVVTNQSGVGRGLMTLSQMHAVNRRFLQLLREQKAGVDGVYWCPHAPSAQCFCRKPNTKLVKKAAQALKMSWRGAISVGDRSSDVELGQNTDGQGVLVLTGYGKRWEKKRQGARPDFVASRFSQAATWIIQQHERKSS